MFVFILSLNFRTPCYSNLWAWASLVSVATSCLCMPCQDWMWKQHCLAFQLWRFFITSIMINLWKDVKEKCYQEIVALCLFGTPCDSCWSLIIQFTFWVSQNWMFAPCKFIIIELSLNYPYDTNSNSIGYYTLYFVENMKTCCL